MILEIIKKKFVKDVILNYISSIILGASALLLNTIVGNKYNPEGLGVFNQALAIYMLAALVSVFGIHISVIKHSAEYSDNNDELKKILSSSICITLIISSFLTLLLILLSYTTPVFYFNEDVNISTRIILLSLPFLTTNKVFAAMLNGLREMKIYALNQSIRWILLIAVILIFIILDYELQYIFFSFLITELIITIWLISYINKHIRVTIKFDKYWVKKHLNFGKMNLLANFLGETNSKTDIFLLGFFLSSYHVGIYSIASTIAKGLLMFSSSVQLNINPIISSLWAKGDIEKINNYVKKVRKGTFLFTLPMIVIAGILYPIYIYVFMSSSSYIESIPVFYILLAGVFFPSIYYFAGAFLPMSNFLKTALLGIFIVLIFNIITTTMLINILGIYGGAISTSLTYILSTLIMAWLIKMKMYVKL